MQIKLYVFDRFTSERKIFLCEISVLYHIFPHLLFIKEMFQIFLPIKLLKK